MGIFKTIGDSFVSAVTYGTQHRFKAALTLSLAFSAQQEFKDEHLYIADMLNQVLVWECMVTAPGYLKNEYLTENFKHFCEPIRERDLEIFSRNSLYHSYLANLTRVQFAIHEQRYIEMFDERYAVRGTDPFLRPE